MRQIKKVKAASMFALVMELLENGHDARVTVSGNSMSPFLRDGVDSVEFTKGSFDQLSKGDIVLIRRPGGGYVMHRLCKKNHDCFFMVGDAQQWIEGPLYSGQLIAVVKAIWRKDKRISCSNLEWRLLSWAWLNLRPFRYVIFRVHRKLQKIRATVFEQK